MCRMAKKAACRCLSRRILVTESLPLPIRGPATKKFEFTKLLKSGSSKTLQNREPGGADGVATRPGMRCWRLPYLMEYPYECSEQTFNRLYANALARNIANSDPKIRRIFDQWKNTPALESPLQKNQDLKAVMLEETPWLRQAENESQARRNVGILFDDNRLNYETEAHAAQADRACNWPTAAGRGSPAGRATITSRFTSPPASAGCGIWAWTSTWPRPSARSSGWMPG